MDHRRTKHGHGMECGPSWQLSELTGLVRKACWIVGDLSWKDLAVEGGSMVCPKVGLNMSYPGDQDFAIYLSIYLSIDMYTFVYLFLCRAMIGPRWS